MQIPGGARGGGVVMDEIDTCIRGIAEVSQRKTKNVVFKFEASKFSSRLHKI